MPLPSRGEHRDHHQVPGVGLALRHPAPVRLRCVREDILGAGGILQRCVAAMVPSGCRAFFVALHFTYSMGGFSSGTAGLISRGAAPPRDTASWSKSLFWA